MEQFDDVTLQQWSIIVGFLMPAVIAIVNQSTWSKTLRGLVAFASSLVAAFVTTYLETGFDTEDFVKSGIFVFGAAVVTYHTWWKPSTIAPRIEIATSPTDNRELPPVV